MPIIRAEIWKGSTREVRKAMAASLTKAAVETLGCPIQAVTVILEEIEKENWFIGAKDCGELFPPPRS